MRLGSELNKYKKEIIHTMIKQEHLDLYHFFTDDQRGLIACMFIMLSVIAISIILFCAKNAIYDNGNTKKANTIFGILISIFIIVSAICSYKLVTSQNFYTVDTIETVSNVDLDTYHTLFSNNIKQTIHFERNDKRYTIDAPNELIVHKGDRIHIKSDRFGATIHNGNINNSEVQQGDIKVTKIK